MSNSKPILIEETNLSYAWGRILLQIIDNPGKEISPLVVSLTGFHEGIPQEDNNIKNELDKFLEKNGNEKVKKVEDVANTIFPNDYWKESDGNYQKFFQSYINNLDKIKDESEQKYRPCLYFERLVAFGCEAHDGNQLEYIISQYSNNPSARRTKFQASIFDPARDHVNDARLRFPCLQHISFVPNNQEKTLVLNAFYVTQQLFEKAYGNYLGLCRLGNFMANQMGLKFERMNCFIGVEKLDTVPKKSLKELRDFVGQILPD
jgi:thymidylate synthase